MTKEEKFSFDQLQNNLQLLVTRVERLERQLGFTAEPPKFTGKGR